MVEVGVATVVVLVNSPTPFPQREFGVGVPALVAPGIITQS